MGRFTDLIATGEFTRRDLIIFIGAMIGLSIVVAAFRYLWRIHIMGTSRKMEYTLRNMLFGHLQGLDTEFSIATKRVI